MFGEIVSFFKASFWGTFAWLCYIESPRSKLGGIWLRQNEKGNWSVNLPSLWHFICSPLRNIFFWMPKQWDLNFWIIFFTSGFIGLILTPLRRISTNLFVEIFNVVNFKNFI